MEYVVFDLEWNQCPDGKERQNEDLPFEIIEIGAVKLNGAGEVAGYYQKYVKPAVYQWLHVRTKELLHMEYRKLREMGRPFVEVLREFFQWCGPECSFCTWGEQDLMELQRNMEFYQVLHWLKGPVFYFDVQKLFGIAKGSGRVSLERAVEILGLEKTMDFHQAMTDAMYTAQIFQRLDEELVREHFSIDTYQHPRFKREEVRVSRPTCDQYVTREFSEKERLLKDKEIMAVKCPKCQRNVRRKLKWFTGNAKNYYCLGKCQEHGFVQGRIRVRRDGKGNYYGVKTLRLVNEARAEEIRERFWQIQERKGSLRSQ